MIKQSANYSASQEGKTVPREKLTVNKKNLGFLAASVSESLVLQSTAKIPEQLRRPRET